MDDDILIEKIVLAEHDALRDTTGRDDLHYTPNAFTSSGDVD